MRTLYTDNDIDEDMKLTRRDYIKILHHYQPKSQKRTTRATGTMKSIKERAHKILAGKLCRCIKARPGLTAANEGRRVAYCTRTIFNSRGLRPHGFRCKTARGARLTSDVTKTMRTIAM